MAEHRDEIIHKYRLVAHLPDRLFAFTFPMRHLAVGRLRLPPGGRVCEIGCGTGANFAYLVDAVGPSGEVVGVDISPDMVAGARGRVEKAGWGNVQVLEGAAEDISLPGSFDGLLLFAMHDVLTSPRALDNILRCLKPGGRIVAVGPKTATTLPGRLLNPMVRLAYSRFAVSTQDKDRPWRLLAERVDGLEVEEHGPGLMYLVWGVV